VNKDGLGKPREAANRLIAPSLEQTGGAWGQDVQHTYDRDVGAASQLVASRLAQRLLESHVTGELAQRTAMPGWSTIGWDPITGPESAREWACEADQVLVLWDRLCEARLGRAGDSPLVRPRAEPPRARDGRPRPTESGTGRLAAVCERAGSALVLERRAANCEESPRVGCGPRSVAPSRTSFRPWRSAREIGPPNARHSRLDDGRVLSVGSIAWGGHPDAQTDGFIAGDVFRVEDMHLP
jgi:hypothetical protein